MPFSDEFLVHRHRGTSNHIETTPSGGGSSTKTLTWKGVFGATDYIVLIGTSPGASNFLSTAIGSTTPSYIITGMTPGTTYYARVRSVAANGGTGINNSGPDSAELSFVA